MCKNMLINKEERIYFTSITAAISFEEAMEWQADRSKDNKQRLFLPIFCEDWKSFFLAE